MTGFGLAAVGALLVQSYAGDYGWTCSTPLDVDGYRAGMFRHFGKGLEDEAYVIQMHREPPDRHDISWTVFPRPEGPPAGRKYTFLRGRKEAEAFSGGPDYVSIDFRWTGKVTGPIWVYYYGDGMPAGSEMLATARRVRRWTKNGRTMGLSGGLTTPSLLAALAPARRWSVVATDGAGNTIFSDSFEMPAWQKVEAEYRRARIRLDSVEQRFRSDHELRNEDGVQCEDQPSPDSTI